MFAFIANIAKYGRNRIKLWMPFFIMLGYLESAVQSTLHLRVEAAIITDSWQWVGVLYILTDIAIILLGIGLIASGRNKKAGVILLLVHRSLQRLFSIWNCDEFLGDLVDVGCLLLLLAEQLNPLDEWQQKKQRDLQRLLLLSRICLSCLFVLWFREKHNVINYIFGLVCYSCLLLGFCCKFVSGLTVLLLLWHACSEANWNFIFGWNDLTISLSLLSSLLGQVFGFLLLCRLGAGKWSLDAKWAG